MAKPAATDGRFKAAAFCLVVCWLTIAASLRHSIKHYRPRNRGFLNRLAGLARYTPPRFLILLPLALCVAAYQVITSFSFANSPLNIRPNLAAMYAGGYAPALLIILANGVWGFVSPNEDRELARQRRARGAELDAELGVVHKPAWWRRLNPDFVAANDSGVGMRDRIARNVRELGGGRATARNIDRRVQLGASLSPADLLQAQDGGNGDAVEMSSLRRAGSVRSAVVGTPPAADLYGGKSDRRRTERTMQLAAGLLFPDAEGPPPYRSGPPSVTEGGSGIGRGRAGPESAAGGQRPSTPGRSNSTGTTNSITAAPQQVRSMLDI